MKYSSKHPASAKNAPLPDKGKQPGGISDGERKLLLFLKANSPQLCAFITQAAGQSAAERDYSRMNELNTLAQRLSELTTAAWPQALSMAAAAGAGGGS